MEKRVHVLRRADGSTYELPVVGYQRRTVVIDGFDVSSPEFLQTAAWKVVRYRALQRHGARCQCCGASPSDGVTVVNVDHIKPRIRHPELALDVENLQVLCADCNAGKSNWDETDWR